MLFGSGFTTSIGRIRLRSTESTIVHPIGESSIRVTFDVNGKRKVSATTVRRPSGATLLALALGWLALGGFGNALVWGITVTVAAVWMALVMPGELLLGGTIAGSVFVVVCVGLVWMGYRYVQQIAPRGVP